METVIDLKDLLKHEVMDLYSAEEQIIEALPAMIEKAGNAKLKAALEDHLKVTKNQKTRLDEIKQLLGEEPAGEKSGGGFFSRLFGGGGEKCKGMEGLISEGEKMMSADMSPEAADAAIIASAQKIEHYEISGYGTARAFARELNLGEVAAKLEQTLNEEYQADDLLTKLAVGQINTDAEFAEDPDKKKAPAKPSKAKPKGSSVAKNKTTSAAKKSTGKSSSAKSSSSKAPSKSAAFKGGSALQKSKSSKSNNKKSAVKSKAPAKKSSAKSSKAGSNKSASKPKAIRKR